MSKTNLVNKRQLLRLLLEEQGVSVSASARIPKRPDQDHFPLSFAQQRLWFLEQFDAASPVYNISLAIRLDGPLDLPALAKAFQEVLCRHEVLRATFATFEGQAIQLIAPPTPAPLPLVDLSALPAAQQTGVQESLISTLAQRPFELARGPLVRGAVLRLNPQQHVLSLTLHHIIADGWSLGVLLRELSTLYAACTTAAPAPLAPLPIQYADFAPWQRTWLSGPAL